MTGKSVKATARFPNSALRPSRLEAVFNEAIFNNTAPWITHPFKPKLESTACDDLYKD